MRYDLRFVKLVVEILENFNGQTRKKRRCEHDAVSHNRRKKYSVLKAEEKNSVWPLQIKQICT
jgi:hypothetical protein